MAKTADDVLDAVGEECFMRFIDHLIEDPVASMLMRAINRLLKKIERMTKADEAHALKMEGRLVDAGLCPACGSKPPCGCAQLMSSKSSTQND